MKKEEMGSQQSPHSEEGEKGLLSSILQQPIETLEMCMDKIAVAHFFYPQHCIIYAALLAMREAQKPIDLVTVTGYLTDSKELALVGGAVYLTELLNFVPTAANAEYYVDMMRRKYIRREIIRVGTDLVRRARDDNADEHTILDDAQEKVTSLALETLTKPTLRQVKEGVLETLDKLEKAHAHRGDEVVTGLPTGFNDLNRMTAGFKPKQLIVIAGRPSTGKSALAMNIAEHIAVEAKAAVAVFSMEMSYQELCDRLTCSATGVSLQRLRDGFLGERDFGKLTEGAAKLIKAPLYIDDTRQLWITDFKALARRAVSQLGVKCIVVDYLQLMVSPTRRAKENRVIEITEITAGLKGVAMELDIPVIVAAQLNREAEKRHYGRPKISDLRESGSIEQDADIVMLLWRPIRHINDKIEDERKELAEYLGLDPVGKIDSWATVIIAKQRNGAVGEFTLDYWGDLTRFEGTTEKMWSNREDERQARVGQDEK